MAKKVCEIVSIISRISTILFLVGHHHTSLAFFLASVSLDDGKLVDVINSHFLLGIRYRENR